MLGGITSVSAFTTNDVTTLVNAYTNAFYVVNGADGYFRENQNNANYTYFWWLANETECVLDAYEWSSNATYRVMITNLLTGFESYNGSDWSWNTFNDDVMWACMAYARGYLDTGKTTFRDIAKANFDMCYARAWDTTGTTVPPVGGLFWTTANNSKNSAAIFPGAIAAYLLYQGLGDSSYYSKATNIFFWGRSNLYNAANGQVYDSLASQVPTSYNQGTFIGAADFLGQTADATLAANYTMNSMSGDGYLPRYGIAGNNSIFNAIFIRWMARFMNNRGLQSTYQLWLQNQANAAWNCRRNTDNLSWCQWPYPTPTTISFYSYDCISSFEAILAVPPTQTASPTLVTLTAADAPGTSSFQSGLNWSDATAPSALHDYMANGLTVRTPADASSHYFGGSSLTMSNGAVLACKNTSGGKGISVGTDLFFDNGELANWSGNSTVVAGRATLRAGGGRLDPQGTTFTVVLSIGGPGFLRVKAASSSQQSGTVILAGNNTYTGGTIIDAADTVKLSGLGTLGDASGSLTFSNSAGFGYGTVDLNGTNLSVGNLSGTGGTLLNNYGTNNSELTIGTGNASGGVFQGKILDHSTGSGIVSLVKTGTGTLTLSGANNYSGNTTIRAGTLAVTGAGALGTGPLITLAAGATLDVTGRSGQTLTLASGQTLTGSGALQGNLSVGVGATLQPGDTIGSLTAQGNITLAGSLQLALNRTNTPLNDQLVSTAGTIAGGGTLTVSNLGPALVAGDSFPLFSGAVTGFTTISLPPLPSSLMWSNRLAIDGTLRVVTIPDASVKVTSPDSNVVVTVTVTSGSLAYAVDYRGVQVLEPSPLGAVVNGASLGVGVFFLGASAYATNETFLSRHGIHASATNQYQAQSISLNHLASGWSYLLDVRAYNNGLAFRYEFTDPATKTITAESSSFVIPVGSTVWSQSATSVYEGIYSGTNITALAANAVIGPPVTVQLSGNNGFLAITESTLGVYGDPYLQKVGGGTGRQLQVVYPVNQDSTTGGSFAGGGSTPWNVVMVGQDLNSLVNNDIVESLAPAPDPSLFPQGTATTWATTGRSVWDWLRPQPGGITPNGAMTNSYWAAQLGFEYNTIDAGWANWTNASGVIDPWPLAQQVVSYSHALGVKVLLWKSSSELNNLAQRSAFFQQLQSYGVDGFKADFFDFNSVSASAKERVQLQETLLREAAGFQLVANFHGSTKPTGQFRTFPNLIEVEAIYGKEQWPNSASIISVPFTRFLAGPADFTPMEFGGNAAFEVANVINMPGPIITFAERSDIIASSPFASLIRTIPSTWDETRVLSQSNLGQTTATARRRGQDWYIGIMNTGVTQSWSIPLTFLAANTNYQAYLIRESSSTLESATLTRDSVLSVSISMTGGSGFVAKLFHPPAFTTSTNFLLSGAIIGTSGSWSNLGNTKEKAFDGSLSTFFDAPTASSAWVGLDLGSGNQKILTTIRYYPRPNWSPRMVGGMFQGANAPDFSDAVTVYTIGYTPPESSFTTVTIANSTVYRYLRYISPANGWCNVAEIQFYGAPMPSPPTGLAATTNSNQITLSWNASPNATGYNLRRAFNSGGPYMIIATNLANTTYTDTGLENGVTCYYVVSALAVGLESAFSAEINAAPGAPLPPLLTLTWNGTNLTLNWQGGGLLLEATNPSGPWTTNLGASSPLIVAPIQPQKFYRVRSQ